MKLSMKLMLAVALAIGARSDPDYTKLLAAAKSSLAEAVRRGLAEAKGGVAVQAELEEEQGRVVWSLDIAQGDKVKAILLDARTDAVVESETEDEDFSTVVAASRVTLAAAVEAALAGSKGKAFHAELRAQDGKAEAIVKLLEDGVVTVVSVDGVTGVVRDRKSAKQDAGTAAAAGERFTKTFGEDPRDLVPTGVNPFFVLEPGYVLVLEGKSDGKDAKLTITVLADTRMIDGVETRAVEEREEVGGQLREVTRDFFAISRRTNNVYYFGEDVDDYEDGKVVGHSGAWLSGEKGARYGLIMMGTPLLGARYYQEVAPGVALDRAEVVSLSATCECPAGKFENVLKTEETTPLEQGERETKMYARGIGLLVDGGLKLTRHGKGAK